MTEDRRIYNTWAIISAVTAIVFILSGTIQWSFESLFWPSMMKFSSALLLLLFAAAILFKKTVISKSLPMYVILFFFGYVLTLTGAMTHSSVWLWVAGMALLLLCNYIAFSNKSSERGNL
jgi:hypothetical protein